MRKLNLKRDRIRMHLDPIFFAVEIPTRKLSHTLSFSWWNEIFWLLWYFQSITIKHLICRANHSCLDLSIGRSQRCLMTSRSRCYRRWRISKRLSCVKTLVVKRREHDRCWCVGWGTHRCRCGASGDSGVGMVDRRRRKGCMWRWKRRKWWWDSGRANSWTYRIHFGTVLK